MGSASLGSQDTVVAGHRAQPSGAALLGSKETTSPTGGPRKVLRSFCGLMRGMTFREPLTFLGLGLFPCK